MSYCEIVQIKNGVVRTTEFKDHRLGVTVIWETLYAKYLNDGVVKNIRLFTDLDYDRLWDLPSIGIDSHECAVLLFTFDNFMVKRDNIMIMVDCLNTFVKLNLTVDGTTRQNHLSGWAKTMAGSVADITALNGTSVMEPRWYRWDDAQKRCVFNDDPNLPVYEVFSKHPHTKRLFLK